MKVKNKYSSVSEQFLFEFTLNESRMNFNRYHYAFWMSVKELDTRELTLDEQIRIDKILDLHTRTLRRPKHRK